MIPGVLDNQPRRQRLFRGLVAIALFILFATAVHAPLLRAVGRLLVASDVAGHVELAVATTDSGAAGLLELGDLFHERVADTVAVFVQPPTSADRELERRGVPDREHRRELLIDLGVPNDRILSIPTPEVGTTESSVALREWCRSHSINRALVIVSATHGRRAQRAFRRAWNNDRLVPLVKIPRFDPFAPDCWWLTRSTLREGIVETEKLLLDVVSHPFEILR